MTYYNYHAKIKQKILQGELETFKILENHNSISPALVLYFKDGKSYPIRQHKWDEYFELISTLE